VALYSLWLGLFFIFSGYLMPLSFFPRWLREITWWLPFRYTLAFPVETLLGLESRADSLRSLAVQWLYVIGFLGTAILVWRRGLVRYAVFGG
jgi:ABC-2 type transport system permease protein